MLEQVLEEHELLDGCRWTTQNKLQYGTKCVWFISREIQKHCLGFHYNYTVDDLGELEDYMQFEQAQRWYEQPLLPPEEREARPRFRVFTWDAVTAGLSPAHPTGK